jgi:hypothetical protein
MTHCRKEIRSPLRTERKTKHLRWYDDPWGCSPSSADWIRNRIDSHAFGDELDDTDDDGWVGSVPPHRQVQTSRGVLIDEDIAALLEAVWGAGIETSYSCQGGQLVDFAGETWRDDDVRAYICFPTVDDALSFMRRSATQLDWTDRVVDELQMTLAQPVSELDGRPVLTLFDSDAVRATVRWPIGYNHALTEAWAQQ